MNATNTAICPRCGESFAQHGTGRPRTYCDNCAPVRRSPASKPVKPSDDAGAITAALDVSKRAILVELRKAIANALDAGVQPRDLAPLTRRLLEVNAELEQLDAIIDDPITAATQLPDEAWNPEED